jgi:hypothetical protein
MALSMRSLVNRRATNKVVQLQNRLGEFTKPPIESGDLNVKSDLYVAGNLHVSGTIHTAQSGQVVNMAVLSNIELNLTETMIVSAQTTDTVFSYTYTPVNANSYILVEYQSNYSLTGSGDDIIEAYIYMNNNMIGKTKQSWVDGTGTRSGTIFPILGRYTNSDITSKEIRVDINANNSNDDVDVDSDISTWLKITEIRR